MSHGIFEEGVVESVEHFDRVEIFFSVVERLLDRHPHHAAQNGSVEKGNDSGPTGLGEDQAEAVFGEMEEIEIKTVEGNSLMNGDPHFHL